MRLQVSLELMISMALTMPFIVLSIHLAYAVYNRAVTLLNSSADLLTNISRTYYSSVQACQFCLH